MTTTAQLTVQEAARAVEALKVAEFYKEAGRLARREGLLHNYGCHFGMRSTRDYAIREFEEGYGEPVEATSTDQVEQDVLLAVDHTLARGTAHHARNGDRTVAFRFHRDTGRFSLTFSDGVVENDINIYEARQMAICFLGHAKPTKPTKARKPLKRTSIRLGAGWSISLRRDEVIPNDPGAGCPATVCGPFGVQASFDCAANEGEARGPDGYVEIPAHIARVLQRQEIEDQVNAYIDQVTEWLAQA